MSPGDIVDVYIKQEKENGVSGWHFEQSCRLMVLPGSPQFLA